MKKNILFTHFLCLFTAYSFGQTFGHTVISINTTNTSVAKDIICPFINDNGGVNLLSLRNGRSTRKFNITGRSFPVGTILSLAPNSSSTEVGYYVVLYSKTSRHADEDENYSNPNLFAIQDFDCDNDGIPNSQDNCDKQAGPASNNGCPGNPELSIALSSSTIFSDCSLFTCDVEFDSVGTDQHFVNTGGVATISIVVNNTGGLVSNNSNIAIYRSIDDTLNTSGSSAEVKVKERNMSAINPNQSKRFDIALFYADFNSFKGPTFLIVKIDDNNSNNETNEDDNTFVLRFRVN